MPTWLKEMYVSSGWKMVVTSTNVGAAYGYNYGVAALTDYGLMTIYFVSINQLHHTMAHELGHFIDGYYNFPSSSYEFINIFNSEWYKYSDPLQQLVNPSHREPAEFFAEIVYCIISNNSVCKYEVPNAYNFVLNYIG